MKKLAITFFSYFFSLQCYAGEFAVSPMIIDFESSPRQTESFSFEIFGKTEGEVRIFMSDLEQQATGHMAFMEFGEAYSGMADWVELSQASAEIEQDERVTISGELQVPSDAKGTYLAAVMIEEVKDSSVPGFNVNVRYAIILNLHIDGRRTRLDSSFTDLSLEEQDGNLFAVAWFQNLSDTDAFIESEVQIRGADSRLVSRVPLRTQSAWQRGDDTSRVFPGGLVKLYGPVIANLDDGEYQMIARNRFAGISLPSTRISYNYVRAEEPEIALIALVDIELPAIKITPNAQGTVMNRFDFTNPYDRAIEIELMDQNSIAGENIQFLPNKIRLEAGETSSIRLVQRWGEVTPRSGNYSGSLAVGNQRQEFTIPTSL